MVPITLLALQKLANYLTNGDALASQIGALSSPGEEIPTIDASQVVITSASADIGDRNVQLTYPRVALYSGGVKNLQNEKFRSLSGIVAVVAEVWASGNMVTQSDLWIHFYVEAITEILRQNIGDWGDGFFFSGIYDVQFQAPKAGGFGFVQSAKISCNLNVSQN